MRNAFFCLVSVVVVGCGLEVEEPHGARPVGRRGPEAERSARRATGGNQARAFWAIQDTARERAWHLTRDEGRSALAWLRLAKSVGGGAEGTLVEATDASWSFKPGGRALHVIRRDGTAFEVEVLALEGTLSDAFPRAGEALKSEVRYGDGRGWRCELRGGEGGEVTTLCAGVFSFGDRTFSAEIEAVERAEVTVFSSPHATRVDAMTAIEGVIDVEGTEVRLTTETRATNCSDSARCPTFSLQVTMAGHVAGALDVGFSYERASTIEKANTSANVEWSGSITRAGVEVGAMQKRSFIEDRVVLEVALDGDTHAIEALFGN